MSNQSILMNILVYVYVYEYGKPYSKIELKVEELGNFIRNTEQNRNCYLFEIFTQFKFMEKKKTCYGTGLILRRSRYLKREGPDEEPLPELTEKEIMDIIDGIKRRYNILITKLMEYKL